MTSIRQSLLTETIQWTAQRQTARHTRIASGARPVIGVVVFLVVLAMRCRGHILASVLRMGRICRRHVGVHRY